MRISRASCWRAEAGGAGEAFSGAFRRRRAAGGSSAAFFCARFPRDGRDLPAGRGFRVFAKKTQKKRLTQKTNQSFESINHLIEKRAARRGAFEFKRKKLWQ